MHWHTRLTSAQAASVWMGFATAYGGLVSHGGLRESSGEHVLISAAASSIGIPAIQVAKEHGATVLATTRSAEKASALRKAGADHVIMTSEGNIAERIMTATGGKGFGLAFDPVSGPFWHDLIECAAPGARIVSYGSLAYDGTEPTVPLFQMIAKNIQLIGFYVVWHLFDRPELWSEAYFHLCARFENGRYRPVIDQIFPLGDLQAAYEALEANAPVGKIVIKP